MTMLAHHYGKEHQWQTLCSTMLFIENVTISLISMNLSQISNYTSSEIKD
jgi:hypothetical protein